VRYQRNQRGSVLITALILLLVLSLMGIAISERVLLQQKMASNLRQSEVLHQQAEANLLLAEQNIEQASVVALRTVQSSAVGYSVQRDYNNSKTWELSPSIFTKDSNAGSIRYIIEKLDSFNELGSGLGQPKLIESTYFRVTARSHSKLGVYVILQSYYKR